MYSETAGSGKDKGVGIIEPMTSDHLKNKNKSA
jgi:hypothetical protein